MEKTEHTLPDDIGKHYCAVATICANINKLKLAQENLDDVSAGRKSFDVIRTILDIIENKQFVLKNASFSKVATE